MKSCSSIGLSTLTLFIALVWIGYCICIGVDTFTELVDAILVDSIII